MSSMLEYNCKTKLGENESTKTNTGKIDSWSFMFYKHFIAVTSQLASFSGQQQRCDQNSASLALCAGNPSVTDGFPSQRASDAGFPVIASSYTVCFLHQVYATNPGASNPVVSGQCQLDHFQ